MKLVRSLVWTVLIYGAEGWTLTKGDVKGSNQQKCGSTVECHESVELNTEQTKVSSQSITRQLLGFVMSCKISFFGHTIRDGGCELVKCVIQGKVSGKRRRGRPETAYSSNSTKWMYESMERITRNTRDSTEWRRLVRCAARAADHQS